MDRLRKGSFYHKEIARETNPHVHQLESRPPTLKKVFTQTQRQNRNLKFPPTSDRVENEF